eukprot:scaffold8896_cov67-Phaeocystis_antarctica.AAC.17
MTANGPMCPPAAGTAHSKHCVMHARYWALRECCSPHHAMKPRKLNAMPTHMQTIQPRTRSLKDMLGHSGTHSRPHGVERIGRWRRFRAAEILPEGSGRHSAQARSVSQPGRPPANRAAG